jgi:hypothetical protein
MSEEDGAVQLADDLDSLSQDRNGVFYGAGKSLWEKVAPNQQTWP